MTNITPTTMILILIAIALIISPFALTGLRDLFKEFREAWFRDWGGDDNGDNDWFGGNGNGTYGLLSMTINYKDGTSRDFKPDPFTLMPLTILDDEGEVQSITFDAKASVEYTGTLKEWGSAISLSCLPRTVDGGKVDIWDPYLFSETAKPSGTSWISGDEKILYTKTVQASEIQTFMENAGASSGKYKLGISFEITFNINFDDGSSDQTKGNTEIDWFFDYDKLVPMITSFAVSITYTRT